MMSRARSAGVDRRDRIVVALALVALTIGVAAADEGPSVSNVVVQQRPGTHLVDITYDLADATFDTLIVRLFFSEDAGANWTHACRSVSGHVGREVPAGTARHIVWDAGADLPGVNLPACRVRVVADQWLWPPTITSVRRLAGTGTDTLSFTRGDTIPFGAPFGFTWTATSAATEVYPPQVLAQLDTTAPLDGLLGFQYGCSPSGCAAGDPACWLPRRFDEATGDSVPYFGPARSAWFANDDSGPDIRQRRLASGTHNLSLNAIDVDGTEASRWSQYWSRIAFVVNCDPQTIVLDGQADWAHPGDPESYPYYIELGDPAQVHHPFRSGDRIPDRTYVVAKALARDDARDLRLDPGHPTGITGRVYGLRQNLTGGDFPFMSEEAAMATQPTWPAGLDGWYGDTLGFLTAPGQMTIHMMGVDEHGRRDGTPASLSFAVGHAPCLQCIELLPRPGFSAPVFGPDTPCVEDTSATHLAGHPCLAGVTELRVSAPNVPDPDPTRDLLPVAGTWYMLVDRTTGAITGRSTMPSRTDSLANYVMFASRFRYAIEFTGRDDPREAWPEAVRRIGGLQYRVSHACDPANTNRDGIGSDDLVQPLWGEPASGGGLAIDTQDGSWRLDVDVYVPTMLLSLGEVNFRYYVGAVLAAGNPQVVEFIWDAVTRPFGEASVEAIVLDQTSCDALPTRPATFNFFRNVRPDLALAAGQTWRDCDLSSPAIQSKLALWQAAMRSLDGAPVRKRFRLTLNPQTGADIVCAAD